MAPRSRGSASPTSSYNEKLINDEEINDCCEGLDCKRKKSCMWLLLGLIVSVLLLGYLPLYCTVTTTEVNLQFAWNANMSRNTRLYVHPENSTALIPNEKLCHNDSAPYLLVIVTSGIDRIESRLAIRDTWGSVFQDHDYQGYDVRLAFLVGRPVNNSYQDRIAAESNAFGDVIQEDFIDTYYNLTVKSMMMLKWVNMHCSNAKYVLKIDDDVYLNTDNLLALLRIYGRDGLVGGSLFCNVMPIRQPSSKWFCPSFIYPQRVYPPYVSGTAYLLSGDSIPKLYDSALSIPLVHLEDVFVTGIVAQKAGLTPVHFAVFDHNEVKLEACNYSQQVTVHGVEPAEMRFVWSELHMPNLKCDILDLSKLKVKGCIIHHRRNSKISSLRVHRKQV